MKCKFCGKGLEESTTKQYRVCGGCVIDILRDEAPEYYRSWESLTQDQREELEE